MAGKVRWHLAQAPGTFFLPGSPHLLATSSPTTGLNSTVKECEVVTRQGTLRNGSREWGHLLGTSLQGLCPSLSCVSR